MRFVNRMKLSTTDCPTACLFSTMSLSGLSLIHDDWKWHRARQIVANAIPSRGGLLGSPQDAFGRKLFFGDHECDQVRTVVEQDSRTMPENVPNVFEMLDSIVAALAVNVNASLANYLGNVVLRRPQITGGSNRSTSGLQDG